VRDAPLPVLVAPADAAAGEGPVLIGYDESEHGDRAVTAAAALFGGRETVVLHVWRSQIRHSLTGQAFQRAPVHDVRETVDELDGLFEDWAREEADKGAALAREGGLDARPEIAESKEPVAEVLLAAARERDAAVLAVGRRGRGTLKSTLLGSVSASVLHATDRPVLIA
jgi:nucleotide-binding universal stress UspA family protein